MATNTNTGSTGETSGAGETSGNDPSQDQQQGTPGETPGEEQQQASTPQEQVKLPDDHPLVKSLGVLKATLAAQKTELSELRATSTKVTKLEDDLKTRPTAEAVETLQTRYDRLEGFLQAVGGPLSKALDSRSFTRDLFETDKDIDGLVKEWQRANPSQTSSALGAGPADPSKNKIDPNVLLRAAAGK